MLSGAAYDVVLTSTDDDGQTCEAALRIVIEDGETNLPDTPGVLAEPLVLVAEVGEEVAFYSDSLDLQGQDVTYRWDFGDQGTSEDPAPVHTYLARGRFPVTLNVLDTDGNTSIATGSIYVYQRLQTFLPFVSSSGASAQGTPASSQATTERPGPCQVPATPPKNIRIVSSRNLVCGPGVFQPKDGDNGRNDVGSIAAGKPGERGGSIWIHSTKTLTIQGLTTFRLASGGNGGLARAAPASGYAMAMGGAGGVPGSLHLGGDHGLVLGAGVAIVLGSGGQGGNATASGGNAPNGGAVGKPGGKAEAWGGNGGSASTVVRVWGHPLGIGGVTMVSARGGNGGDAFATGGSGGDAVGVQTAVGGRAGSATGIGGNGGNARYSYHRPPGLPLPAPLPKAGNGGDAIADTGTGGDAIATQAVNGGSATARGGNWEDSERAEKTAREPKPGEATEDKEKSQGRAAVRWRPVDQVARRTQLP